MIVSQLIDYLIDLKVAISDNDKKKFKKKITSTQINKVWADYIEEEITKPLSFGAIVNIDKYSKIWVKATPLVEHKRAMSLLEKGLIYNGGRIKEANISFDNSEYIYKVVYENKSFDKKIQLYYKPHSNISKAVNEGIKQGKLITRLQCQ